MRSFIKNFLAIFLVLLLVAGVLSMTRGQKGSEPEQIDIGKLVEEINTGAVKKVDRKSVV